MPEALRLIARGATARERRDIIPGDSGSVRANNQELITGIEFQDTDIISNKEVALPVNRQAIGRCYAIDQNAGCYPFRIEGDNRTPYCKIEFVMEPIIG